MPLSRKTKGSEHQVRSQNHGHQVDPARRIGIPRLRTHPRRLRTGQLVPVRLHAILGPRVLDGIPEEDLDEMLHALVPILNLQLDVFLARAETRLL